MSLKYHPDKVKGKPDEKDCSQSHFIAITKAYETLRYAPQKRIFVSSRHLRERVSVSVSVSLSVSVSVRSRDLDPARLPHVRFSVCHCR